jgi:hypothetical protein
MKREGVIDEKTARAEMAQMRQRRTINAIVAVIALVLVGLIIWQAVALVNAPATPIVTSGDYYTNPELKSFHRYQETVAEAAAAEALYINPELKVFRAYEPSASVLAADRRFLATNPEMNVFRRYQEEMLGR